jgi:hypothetical protein
MSSAPVLVLRDWITCVPAKLILATHKSSMARETYQASVDPRPYCGSEVHFCTPSRSRMDELKQAPTASPELLHTGDGRTRRQVATCS